MCWVPCVLAIMAVVSTVFFTAVFAILFLLSFRTILRYVATSKMYKSYFAALQSYWSSFTDMSEKTRANLIDQVMQKLREDGGDLLEIGIAVGKNLKYLNLPQDSSYIALDYNPKMESYLRENLKKYPDQNIPLKRFIAEDAANMASISDNSVAVVLGTQMMCSLEQEKVKSVLKEIRRVLKPGGYFYFMEHVLDEPGTTRRTLQLLSGVGELLPLFFDGCHLNKETWKDVERAGFQKVVYDKALVPTYFSWKFPVLSTLRYLAQLKLTGYAVK